MQIEFRNNVLKHKLLSLNDKVEWSTYLDKLPESMQDVYYTPEYYEIYEKHGDGKAFCFVFEDGNGLALYPFLLNNINNLGYELDDNYYDIQGAYGYNGVVYSSDNPDFKKNFYNEFNKFCKGKNIIAEFTRFHPLLENYKFSEGYLDVSFNRQTVYVDLTKGYDKIYRNYNRKVKRYLRNANQNNLIPFTYNDKVFDKKVFSQIYQENMDRVNSGPYLYFNEEYFNNIFSTMSMIQIVLFKGELPVCSLICLLWKNYINGHLAGSKNEYLSMGTVAITYDAAIRYGIEKGYMKLHLGGGRSTDEEDSLLVFKKKFSKTTKNFYIGKKIYNKEVLDKIYEQWKNKYPNLVDKYKNNLLKYRFLAGIAFLLITSIFNA